MRMKKKKKIVDYLAFTFDIISTLNKFSFYFSTSIQQSKILGRERS
jgi:hypothetical protein